MCLKESAILRVLYELAVPAWPLVLWVAFRTGVDDQLEPTPLHAFLDILSGPDRDIFAWDDDGDLMVKNVLSLFVRSPYMAEINLKTWLQIRNMTQTIARPRCSYDNLRIRLLAMAFRYSSALNALQKILATVDLSSDFRLTSIIRIVDKNYQLRLPPPNFESKEFWANPNLESWLLARSKALCHSIWCASPERRVLERVQCMDLVLTQTLPLLQVGVSVSTSLLLWLNIK
jgi:hypothetical protein